MPAGSFYDPEVRRAMFIVGLAVKRLEKPLPKAHPLAPEWENTTQAIIAEDLCINEEEP